MTTYSSSCWRDDEVNHTIQQPKKQAIYIQQHALRPYSSTHRTSASLWISGFFHGIQAWQPFGGNALSPAQTKTHAQTTKSLGNLLRAKTKHSASSLCLHMYLCTKATVVSWGATLDSGCLKKVSQN